MTQDSAEEIRKVIKGIYADLPQSRIVFEGGIRVWNLDQKRSSNLTFLEYRTKRKGDNLIYEEIQEEIPEHLKEKYKDNKMAREAMGEDSDKRLAQELENQLGQKKSPLGMNLLTKPASPRRSFLMHPPQKTNKRFH